MVSVCLIWPACPVRAIGWLCWVGTHTCSLSVPADWSLSGLPLLVNNTYRKVLVKMAPRLMRLHKGSLSSPILLSLSGRQGHQLWPRCWTPSMWAFPEKSLYFSLLFVWSLKLKHQKDLPVLMQLQKLIELFLTCLIAVNLSKFSTTKVLYLCIQLLWQCC